MRLLAALVLSLAVSQVPALLTSPARGGRGSDDPSRPVVSVGSNPHSNDARAQFVDALKAASQDLPPRRASTRSFAAQADTSMSTYTSADGVKVSHFTLPGGVDQVMYIDDTTLVVRSRGDLFVTRNHGRAWQCWTCDTAFGGKLSGAVQQFWSQTDALSTERLEKSIRAKFNRQIAVVTNTATYAISMLPDGNKGAPQELVIADSAALRAHPSLKAGSMRFDALEFHPTKPNERAFGFITDPNCNKFSGRCDSFAFVTTDLKHFYLVPLPEIMLLMWENPVGPRTMNYTMPVVERHQGAFDGKAYNPGDFFMVLAESRTTPYGSLVRAPLDGVNWASVTEGELTGRLKTIHKHVAAAQAIVGHEYVGGYDMSSSEDGSHELKGAYFAASKDNFKSLFTLDFPSQIFHEGDVRDLGPETGYTVVSESEDVFITVHRTSDRNSQLWGHTYMSGLRGLRYATSLTYNRVAPPEKPGETSHTVDFHRVSGLDGILLANKITNPDDAPCRRCGARECAHECHVATVISRDNGKTWQPLKTATSTRVGDSDMILDDDEEGKPLHLHGLASVQSPILSSRHAPGLLLASGNVGRRLHQGDGAVSDVWLSRNGGRTWHIVARGPHLYGEGDLGALVFLVPRGVTSAERGAHLNFSSDGGQTFRSTPLLKEGDTTRMKFVWVGRPVHDPLTRAAQLVAVDERNRIHMLRVDFRGTEARSHCTGMSSPDEDDSDFETFSPQSHGAAGCLLGSHSAYLRKKAGRDCWITSDKIRTTIDYSLPVTSTPCMCTFDDYDCDFGFDEQPDGRCSKTKGAPSGERICKAHASGYQWASLFMNAAGTHYMNTKGYRKIAGDRCEDGVKAEVEVNPKWVACPHTVAAKSSHSWLWHILLLGLIIGIFAALYRANPRFRDVVDDSVAAVRPAAEGAVERVRSAFGPGAPQYGSLPTDDVPDAPTASSPAVNNSGAGRLQPAQDDDDEEDDLV